MLSKLRCCLTADPVAHPSPNDLSNLVHRACKSSRKCISFFRLGGKKRCFARLARVILNSVLALLNALGHKIPSRWGQERNCIECTVERKSSRGARKFVRLSGLCRGRFATRRIYVYKRCDDVSVHCARTGPCGYSMQQACITRREPSIEPRYQRERRGINVELTRLCLVKEELAVRSASHVYRFLPV